MKICRDGRIWGQNNKEAGSHLGLITGRRRNYIKRGYAKRRSDAEERKGEGNPFYGKHHTMETRRKMSDARKGDKGSNWQGGVSSRNNSIRKGIESRLWREAVFARDNWTCRECGKRGEKLNAHHIKDFKQYPELRFAIDNGKTLCLDCHKLTENYAGRNNHNV